MICVDTRHMRAALAAQVNKSDRNDARGIAQMMRVGLYRPVHVKTLSSQKRRMLLTSRNCCRPRPSTSRMTFAARCAISVSRWASRAGKFEARIRELVEDTIWPRSSSRCSLSGGSSRADGVLHRRLLAIVRDDAVCRRLMTVPGVGPVVALTFASRSMCQLALRTPRQSVRSLA